jgi:hypothetical protein
MSYRNSRWRKRRSSTSRRKPPRKTKNHKPKRERRKTMMHRVRSPRWLPLRIQVLRWELANRDWEAQGQEQQKEDQGGH